MLSLSGIHKQYKIGSTILPILSNVCLTIADGEYVSIMGGSGSGKSTLLNIIGCLDTPDSGEYIFFGKNIGTLDSNELAQLRLNNIGIIFQSFNLIPRLSAYRNVELPLLYSCIPSKIRKSMALKALSKVGLKDRINHKPSQLSGGQQQRVALARAIVNKPNLLIADEPTGSLDSRSSEEVLNLINELNKSGVSIIMVTHDQSVANKSDRIVQIDDGKLIEPNLE